MKRVMGLKVTERKSFPALLADFKKVNVSFKIFEKNHTKTKRNFLTSLFIFSEIGYCNNLILM